MLSTLSEKKMHAIRWAVLLAWVLLIVSLFYDPVSAVLTDPANGGWLADDAIAVAKQSDLCVSTQGYCVDSAPYQISTRIFWGMVIPSAIFVVFVFGHEFWRRICPLYFFSQLPRALGMKPMLNIERNQWLQQNHLYLQFVLFFLGISYRILVVNSVRNALGEFFIFTLLSAAGVVALYGGRSWCHYVCPFGMVQTVFTGPRGLLGSGAHQAEPYSLTQSMCRTASKNVSKDANNNSAEESACVSCKSACMDIDAEQSYWERLHQPGRKLVQYGYLGLVIGYFCYYGLYAGNFRYYFSGVWSHDPRTIVSLLEPGFYLFEQAIAIPKILAVPLTLATFAAASCWICTRLERYYRGYLKAKSVGDDGAIADKSLHRMFSLCTFVAFNFFFIYGGRPELNRLPIVAQFAFQTLIAVVSSLWLYRTWGRSEAVYKQESVVSKRRRQLKKLAVDVDELLGDEQATDRLNAETVDVLAQVLPHLVVKPEGGVDSKELALPKTKIRRPQTSVPRKPAKASEPQRTISKAEAPKTVLRPDSTYKTTMRKR